jgi:DNA-binding response OmpR family regulator
MNIALLMGNSPQLRTVAELLEGAGFGCNVFETGRELVQGVSQVPYDMLLIDDALPDLPALAVVHAVRSAGSRDVPIILMAADNNEDNLIDALDAGADDYVCRPLNPRVLMARITALRRRVTGERLRQGLVVRAGPYQLNSVGRFATLRGERIAMTPKEFDLAMMLFSNVGRVLASDRIQQAIWHHELPPLSRALAGLISRLRKTLRIGMANGIVITVVYAHGYRLDVLEERPRLPKAMARVAAPKPPGN